MLFPQLFEQSVARTPERPAIVHLNGDEELTYAEVQTRAYAVANELHDRGIDPGDRVAICMANRPEHVITFLGTQLAGVVAVPFNFRLAAGGVRYHLQDSDPELFFFDSISRESVAGIADGFDLDMVYVGDETPDFAESFESFSDSAPERPDVSVAHDDPSVMLYSSGTTGDPKGIPLDHEATVDRWIINSLGQRYYLEETLIGVMPLYHTVGLHGILCGLLSMSGTYLCMSQFDPEIAVRAIEEHQVTALHEAPTIFANMLDSDAIDETDLSSVRAIGYSGAPMSQSIFDRAIETFEPDHIANLYGTTEVYGTLAYLDLHDIGDPTVTGPANVGIETRVVEIGSDDPNDRVDPGKQGELIVNTDSSVSFDGYWNKPEATAEAIHEGWLYTGDAARLTEENRIVITGRVDDMIISGGENIHPTEVEDVLLTHPGVSDVGVVGHPDDEWGSIVVAFVERSGDVTAEELDQWCKDSDDLADYKRPREYRFIDELPRNPSGKIERYKLKSNE
ncbi:class I adenylate-forming enzyme family protein [Halobellus captivus]|uniref:class I adenylate-forming enzyme family protein n=1 Tax=Halobellus captivus TaxID=2592614 RepID=UPI0011A339B2|nr:class I adenylate-forming enzyme family protein [Halobellus captivus]